ncbi:unnamed protein product [Didymodactylos carnosus]|uniref:Uncharacterized protein n=1 Tax=Didymodactylos carnosus TaxID=1234261 RepID=A0A814S545_9BILA|nr:unnamed protein product [Didymodactylos carnosus]CAF1610549.1 unnamed protein product [Didymodactylos carnosus]CAF3905959.1 unnamed protein product [Didymodactylos carnosus]CAF4423890.1 unnamed protein product [Didymodactylos carnosus]
MPRGEEFSVDLKKMFYRVIQFVDSEKDGVQIPLTSTTGRIMALIGIGERTVKTLRSELHQLKQEKTVELPIDTRGEEPPTTPRLRTRSALAVSPPVAVSPWATGSRTVKRTWSASHVAATTTIEVPTPPPPQKKGCSGRWRVVLSEAADDVIRLHFALILVRQNSLLSITE